MSWGLTRRTFVQGVAAAEATEHGAFAPPAYDEVPIALSVNGEGTARTGAPPMTAHKLPLVRGVVLTALEEAAGL